MNNHKNFKINSESIFLLLSLALFIVVFFPVFQGLINVWSNSDDFSHGFFILPVSLYVIWMKKDELASINHNLSLSGLFLMIISLLLYVFSRYAGILTLAPIAMILFVISSVAYLYGFEMVHVLIFPLFFMFLMIPIPSQIYSSATIPLQLIVTKIAVNIATLFSIPILRDGNVIYLSDITLQVVNACSGLRSIISLFTLCTILGYLTLKTHFFRIVLCLSSVFIAMFVNIVRVAAMILSYHFFHYDLTHGTIHTIFGILIFLLSLTIVYTFQNILAKGEGKIAGHY